MGLHFGGFGVNLGVLLAREPLNMHVYPLIRTSTPRYAPGRRCPRACHRVNVRVKDSRAQDAFTETEEGLTARRHTDALYMPRETTEVEPRRGPPLVACDDRAVGAEKSPLQQHVVSYNPNVL